MTYDDALARHEALVASHEGIAVKGKANRYTALNGNMFSFLDKSGALCLRIGKEARAALPADQVSEPVVQYGSVMRDYVEVSEAAASDAQVLERLFALSLDHARGLKPR